MALAKPRRQLVPQRGASREGCGQKEQYLICFWKKVIPDGRDRDRTLEDEWREGG
jgi:hypothetical protein